MNTFRLTFLAVLVACSFISNGDAAKAGAAVLQVGRDDGSYNVSLQASTVGGGATWRYTITKINPAAKNLDAFILNLDTCGGESPFIDAFRSATVNGVNWLDRIVETERTTPCGVTSTNVVKFDRLPPASVHVIEFTLERDYPVMDSAVWLDDGAACALRPASGPGCRGYLRTSTMEAEPSVVGARYPDINTYMRRSGFDYTEHPHCTGGFGGHDGGVHGAVVVDQFFNRPVFRFDIHIDPVIDGDRCSSSTVDRQRNEMKSITNNAEWANVQGNWDEWQILEWKFKLPKGLQPTSNFFHIHQLKAQDGPNNGAPTITITPRAGTTGLNNRMQIIHSVDGANTGKGTIVDNVPLSEFEDQWVQVREEMLYRYDGYYSIKMTRIRDGQVLVNFIDQHIDMWRIGSSYIRSKFGLYRSLAGGQLNRTPVGQSPLLKNESIWVTDFRVYERNPNPTPALPHD